MSTIKVNKLEQRSGCTATVGGGAGKTVTVDATTVTLGRCGGAVNLAPGASQSGFGRTGTVDWCTTAKTSPFTAVSGDGFFLNTTGGAITVTLPSSPSQGDIVAFKDYAGTWGCNNVTVARNGSKIGGECACATLNTTAQSVTLIYVDGTKGWQDIHDSTANIRGNAFICASGGCISQSGDFRIHTFNSSANFIVNTAANAPADNAIDYLVVAGGGGIGSTNRTGGGGGGGVRASAGTSTGSYTAGPLAACVASITASAGTFPIAVGAGGAARSQTPEASCGSNAVQGNPGAVSTFSTITSTGGGGSGTVANPGGSPLMNGLPGGSGGGGAAGNGQYGVGGTGNTPPVSPPQGQAGGAGVTPSNNYSGGGGGATEAGVNGDGSTGGRGGAGLTNSINASAVGYGGGGGGAICAPSGAAGAASPCGSGAAGTNSPGSNANNGVTNRGGGGGGLRNSPGNTGGIGGSGVVILRYRIQ